MSYFLVKHPPMFLVCCSRSFYDEQLQTPQYTAEPAVPWLQTLQSGDPVLGLNLKDKGKKRIGLVLLRRHAFVKDRVNYLVTVKCDGQPCMTPTVGNNCPTPMAIASLNSSVSHSSIFFHSPLREPVRQASPHWSVTKTKLSNMLFKLREFENTDRFSFKWLLSVDEKHFENGLFVNADVTKPMWFPSPNFAETQIQNDRWLLRCQIPPEW